MTQLNAHSQRGYMGLPEEDRQLLPPPDHSGLILEETCDDLCKASQPTKYYTPTQESLDIAKGRQPRPGSAHPTGISGSRAQATASLRSLGQLQRESQNHSLLIAIICILLSQQPAFRQLHLSFTEIVFRQYFSITGLISICCRNFLEVWTKIIQRPTVNIFMYSFQSLCIFSISLQILQ